ncbi:MAG: FprA family A-type flavoprotein, partial [Firmicutes bacterium]|nr:FprA family A-type flavoprotein [Bacillota bacterium]
EGWACEARRYYFNIVGKYGAQVQAVLKKLGGLDIQTICPLHGPILKEDLGYYIGIYDTWSKYEPEDDGIFVAYGSIHGNTKAAAEKMAEILKAKGYKKVSVADLSREDLHEAVEDAFRYSRMIVACATYDAGLFPIVETFVNHLKSKNYQNRSVGFIENGSWAPMAAKKLKEAFEGMKNIKIAETVVSIKSVMKDKDVEAMEKLADEML